jgi:hypothetical protein
MKLNLAIALTVLLATAASTFGQKETVKTTTETKTKTETKTVETKMPAVKMPTAQEILAKYVQAIGGRANYEKIKSRMTKGTQEIPAAGIKGTFEIYAAAPNKISNKSVIPGIGEFNDRFDGQTAGVAIRFKAIGIKPAKNGAGKTYQQLYREINLENFIRKWKSKARKRSRKRGYVVVATPADNLPARTLISTRKAVCCCVRTQSEYA